ncbi:MAG: carboxylesterase/lipase family protein [Actinomycetota bacterium]
MSLETHPPIDGTAVEVTTSHGALEGSWHDGVARFAGIPFATPPVGPLRFRPPQSIDGWAGVRPAHEFGPICPQNPSMMDALFGGETETWDEDCLYLNVWTTDVHAEPARPVMVWIHGGGFEMGSGSSPLYHGEAFARSGVVLVTVNYRLGSLGFLELGGLDPSYAGSGNVGLLDQVAALEWVRDNAAAFGGDPGNVTIFGESAGAMSVSLLATMPRARGLFHRVVAQSGAASAARPLADARADTEQFLAEVQLNSIPELLDADVASLLAAHGRINAARMADPEAALREHDSPLAFLAFRPVADGAEVPADPLAAIAGGAAAGIPFVIGTTLEEWKLFALMSPVADSEEKLAERLKVLCTDPESAIAAYRAEFPDATPGEVETAVLTDVVFRVPASELADAQSQHAPVFQYRWDWASPAMCGLIGASHAIEIPFVFDLVEDHRLHVFVGPEAPAPLARAVHESWVAFATSGTPCAVGLPDWPAVGDAARPVLRFDTTSDLLVDPQPEPLRFWYEQR